MLQSDPSAPIRIVGINGIGYEDGNSYIADMQVALPWLQDTPQEDVWARWEPVYRDVIILDASNRKVGVFNLTEHNLDVPAERDALRDLLLEAVGD